MEELITKYHPEKYSSIKTIQGALFAVKCFGGEAPFFFLSVGHLNSIVIGLAVLSFRFFLYFIIKYPVWVLPVELLSGLSFALPYSAITAYACILAPEGLKSTVQGLFSTVFQGVGNVDLGSLITGYLFNEIGSSETYLVMSILALVVCCIQTITIKIMARTTTSQENSDRNSVIARITDVGLLLQTAARYRRSLSSYRVLRPVQDVFNKFRFLKSVANFLSFVHRSGARCTQHPTVRR
ncbi:hypothetical protein QTP88_026600 [Uroleucon formosanum]